MNDVFKSIVKGTLIGAYAFFFGSAVWYVVTYQPRTWETVYHATVKLNLSTFGDFCSGTFIDEDTILTAGHCTEDLPEGDISIVTWDGRKWPVVLGEYAPEYDTATFELLDGYAWNEWVPVAPPDFEVQMGTRAVLAGYPDIQNLHEFKLYEGLVINEGKYVFWATESLAATIISAPGASGGGLFIDLGNGPLLIGTLQGMYRLLEGASYFSTVEGVNEVLNG